MKKWKYLLLFIFFISFVSGRVFAEKGILSKNKTGLIFNMTNLLFSIDEYNDGSQAGAGVKYWFSDNLALRGLVHFNLTSDTTVDPADTVTNTGIGSAVEYHFLKADISPYAGGLLGTKALFNEAGTFFDFYGGGLFGVEIKLKEFLSVYAEYNLLLIVDENGYEIDLSAGNAGQLGLVFYLGHN